MSRNPFVWQTQVRREVLDDEMVRLREVPYSLWRQVVLSPIKKVITARDERQYLLRVAAEHLRDSADIRVTMSLGTTGLLRRNLLRQSFIITPDNHFKA